MTEASHDWQAALDYLYTDAAFVCADCTDTDELVQESMIAYVEAVRRGESIEYPKAWLDRVLRNKYNAWLRKKYRNRIVSYDVLDGMAQEDEDEDHSEEYAEVRREIGRLIRIYREVIVRHYVHGHSVDRVAAELGIPRGTVLSRLHAAREQIREGLEMTEKYSLSYEPKTVGIGIRGSTGKNYEPFSLVKSQIEQNMLYLAYEAPVSLKTIADTMGIPCVFIEPFADRLVDGELMGRTSGGLLYTRGFMRYYADSFGDISAQKALADALAADVWRAAKEGLTPLSAFASFGRMTDKQRATLMLFVFLRALLAAKWRISYPDGFPYQSFPQRPGGGRWLALMTVFSDKDEHCKYESSGPVQTGCRNDAGEQICILHDAQTLFGDAHYAYGRLPMKFDETEILRFYASFMTDQVGNVPTQLYENIKFFEDLHIIRRDESGKAVLDIPTLTLDEEQEMKDIIKTLADMLMEPLGEPLKRLHDGFMNRVPAHVDMRERFIHEGALDVYPSAQLESIVEQGLFPYPVEIGKTPLIVVAYKP